jgi:hypothetical protein
MPKNRKSDGSPRLGRPPGPSPYRDDRPWDDYNELAIRVVAANLDAPRWLLAERLNMSSSKLSTITCSPAGRARLDELTAEQPLWLSDYHLVEV